MANGAKKTYVVAHPRFNVMVEGKMTRVASGDKIKLTEAQALQAGRRVKPEVEGRKLVTGAEEGEKSS